jgi:hypothetical protein
MSTTKAAATPADAPAVQAAVNVTDKYYGGIKLGTGVTIPLATTTSWGATYYGGLPSPDVISVVGA